MFWVRGAPIEQPSKIAQNTIMVKRTFNSTPSVLFAGLGFFVVCVKKSRGSRTALRLIKDRSGAGRMHWKLAILFMVQAYDSHKKPIRQSWGVVGMFEDRRRPHKFTLVTHQTSRAQTPNLWSGHMKDQELWQGEWPQSSRKVIRVEVAIQKMTAPSSERLQPLRIIGVGSCVLLFTQWENNSIFQIAYCSTVAKLCPTLAHHLLNFSARVQNNQTSRNSQPVEANFETSKIKKPIFVETKKFAFVCQINHTPSLANIVAQ